MIRTIVVDDSTTVRQLLVEILEADPEITVVATATNGAEAVDLVTRLAPDLVVMDIHMPVLDGLEATREIMVRAPTPILIVSSAANQRQLELSLSATQAGALLVLPKPEHPRAERFSEMSEQLVVMAKAMASVKVVRRWGTRPRPITLPKRRSQGPDTATRIVAMAASTGGPATLRRILHELPQDFTAPILVVQHIARGFVVGFAQWLEKGCQLRVKIAEDGEPLTAQTVYIAPDDLHLGINGQCRIALADAPPIGGFRPSATHLFDSVARAAGPAAAAVVLTGMGNDGLDGLRSLYSAGGRILAQDRATSVIYGMAQEAVRNEVVDLVLPLDAIAARLTKMVTAGET
jgi:two-component system chemotaxis response regulator CheB